MMLKRFFVCSMIFLFLLSVVTPLLQAQGAKLDGKKVYEKMIAALGGKDKMARINNYYALIEISQPTANPQVQFKYDTKNYIQYPDKLRYIALYPQGTMLLTADGKQGWLESSADKKFNPIRKPELASTLYTVHRDPICISRYFAQYRIDVAAEEITNGKKYISIAFSGLNSFILQLDPVTYLPVHTIYRGEMIGGKPGSVVQYEEELSDYRVVEGVKIPYKVVAFANGRKLSEAFTKEIKCNVKMEKDLFKKTLEATGEK